MNKRDNRILSGSERRINKRLARDNFPEHDGSVLEGPNIHYEMSEKAGAIDCGGIGASHTMCKNTGPANTDEPLFTVNRSGNRPSHWRGRPLDREGRGGDLPGFQAVHSAG